MSNREILFRGFSEESEIWVYGLPSYNGETGEISEIEVYNDDEHTSNLVSVIPETVGLFIGLTDKNGKKIFEGDIVLAGSEGVMANCEVKRRIDGTYYMNLNAGTVWYMMPNRNGKTTVEVIGNIHDNSELLGGEGT